MRITLLLIILYLNPFDCFSQNRSSMDAKIDSLQKELQKSAQDTVRAKLILELVDILGSKGWDTTNQSDFAQSYDTYQKAFDLLENEKTETLFNSFGQSSRLQKTYWSMVANLNFNYGHLMGVTANYKERMRYYKKAYQIAKSWNDVLNIVFSNTGMAIAFIEENKLDSASNRINEAMSYPPNLYNYEEYSTVAYINGRVNFRIANYAVAKKYFLEGIEDARSKNSKIGLAINYMELSKTYTKFGLRDSSYFYAIESLNLLKDLKEIQILNIDLATGYENIYQHFQQFEQPDSAFKYLQLANIERAAFSENKINNLALFQQTLLKRQLQLKNLEKDKLEMQTKNKMYILWIILIVVLIFGAILYYSYRQKHKANTLLSLQKEEIQTALIQLKSTQSQLIQSEKMASLGELTAGIAHEIQNPLNFVNNFSELNSEMIDEQLEEIERGDFEEVKVLALNIKENEYKITHHGKRADAIVKGMLAHSRSGKGEKALTDLNALAEEYLKLSYHGIRAKDKRFNADFKLELDPNLPKVAVVSQDIGRVLLNLINNAFYACSERNSSAKNESLLQAQPDSDFKPLVTVSTKKTERGIEVSVSDNGNGIPDAIKDKIFQPFFTTKPTGQGTGLGLSLSYDIVKAHGGELKVDSKEGTGSKFTIVLKN